MPQLRYNYGGIPNKYGGHHAKNALTNHVICKGAHAKGHMGKVGRERLDAELDVVHTDGSISTETASVCTVDMLQKRVAIHPSKSWNWERSAKFRYVSKTEASAAGAVPF